MLNRLRNLRTPTLPPAHYWQEALIVGAVLAASVLALWLPFGLNMGPTDESWQNINDAAIAASNPDTYCLRASLGRPLIYYPYCFALQTGPQVFTALNLFTIGGMLLKGVSVYVMLRLLFPGELLFALAGALFVNLLTFDFVTLNTFMMHLPMGFLLAAMTALVVFLRTRWWPLWIVVGICQFISQGMYEIGIIMIAVTPLFMLLIDGGPRRRHLAYSALWYTVPLLTTVFISITPYLRTSYQTSHAEPFQSPVVYLLRFVRRVAGQLGLNFTNQLRNFNLTGSDHMLIGLIVLVVVLGGALLQAKTQTQPAPPNRRAGLVGIGLIMILAGLAPYVFSTIPLNSGRTQIYSTFGAALIWAAAVGALSARPRWRPAAYGLLCVLVISGTAWHLNIQHRREQIILAQHTMLHQLAEALPAIPEGAQLIIRGDTPFSHTSKLTAALRYIYQDNSLFVFSCDEQHIIERINCDFDDDALRVSVEAMNILNESPYRGTPQTGERNIVQLPYSQLIVFEQRAGQLNLLPSLSHLAAADGYNPAALTANVDPGLSQIRQTPLMRAATRNSDITNQPTVSVQDGWYNIERNGALRWRWLNTDGELFFPNPSAAHTLQLRANAGPSLTDRPNAVVNIVNAANEVVSSATLDQNSATLTFDLTFEPGVPTVYRVQVEGSTGQRGSPADPRVLNLRVFEVRLLP